MTAMGLFGLVCLVGVLLLVIFWVGRVTGRDFVIDPEEQYRQIEKDKDEGIRVNWKQPPP